MDSALKDKQEILSLLKKENSHIEVITVKETTSTNDELKKIALRQKEGTVLYVAESQSAGKGRKGRSFFSPGNTGIYMSLLLHPCLSPEICTLITPLCAVAVAQAIEKIAGINADIKWVNDIFVAGKKVAGILTEGSFSEKGADYVIVGIGINLAPPEEGFPKDIENIAGALTENSIEIRTVLIAEIVNLFMEHFGKIESREFIPVYKNRLFFLGKEITVISHEGNYEAVAEDIDRMCRLIVRTRKGELRTLHSGEISIKI